MESISMVHETKGEDNMIRHENEHNTTTAKQNITATTSSFPLKFVDIEKRNDGIVDPGTMKVKVRFNRNSQSDADVVTYLEELGIVYAKNRKFLILYDATCITKVSLPHLKQLSDFVKSREADTKRLVTACAVVIPNPVVRALVHPVIFFKKAVCPLLICNTILEAEQFLRKFSDG